MRINQGDIFWITPNETNKIASDHIHPFVVIQVNVSGSVTVCALTSNLKRANEPGNVLLDENEGNLTRQSVVLVSKMSTMDTSELGEYIGTLSERRIDQVLAGIRFLQTLTQHH